MLEFDNQRKDRTGEETYWYRYEPVSHPSTGIDVDGNPLRGKGRLVVNLIRYEVLREKPTGVWVMATTYDRPEPHEKFQCRHWRKKLCYPTKQEAWESLRQRKLRQISILEARITMAKEVAQVIADKGDIPPESVEVPAWKREDLIRRFEQKEPNE